MPSIKILLSLRKNLFITWMPLNWIGTYFVYKGWYENFIALKQQLFSLTTNERTALKVFEAWWLFVADTLSTSGTHAHLTLIFLP